MYLPKLIFVAEILFNIPTREFKLENIKNIPSLVFFISDNNTVITLSLFKSILSIFSFNSFTAF